MTYIRSLWCYFNILLFVQYDFASISFYQATQIIQKYGDCTTSEVGAKLLERVCADPSVVCESLIDAAAGNKNFILQKNFSCFVF